MDLSVQEMQMTRMLLKLYSVIRQTYVREREAMLPVLRDIFETNIGVK